MKRKILIVLLLLIIFTGCVNSSENSTNKDSQKNDSENVKNIEERVEEALSKMTLDEKIGQMMIVFYTSPKMDNTLKKALNDVKPGGFILFKENIPTYDDTLNFIKEIKETSEIPMFISIDQEGGNVQRLLALKDNVSNIPYMQYVGDTNNVSFAKDVGKVIAEELRVFGINMDFYKL